MKIIGVTLAFLILAGVVGGVGYGVFTGYEFLSVQWGSLSNDWKAILIVTASIIVFCTLFAALSIKSSIRKYGLKGTGKVMVYNDFIHWYSALKNDDAEVMKAGNLKIITNQMMLWGSKQVARQSVLLYDLLQTDEADSDQVLQKAEHIYIEIRRDLGLSGAIGDNVII